MIFFLHIIFNFPKKRKPTTKFFRLENAIAFCLCMRCFRNFYPFQKCGGIQFQCSDRRVNVHKGGGWGMGWISIFTYAQTHLHFCLHFSNIHILIKGVFVEASKSKREIAHLKKRRQRLKCISDDEKKKN